MSDRTLQRIWHDGGTPDDKAQLCRAAAREVVLQNDAGALNALAFVASLRCPDWLTLASFDELLRLACRVGNTALVDELALHATDEPNRPGSLAAVVQQVWSTEPCAPDVDMQLRRMYLGMRPDQSASVRRSGRVRVKPVKYRP